MSSSQPYIVSARKYRPSDFNSVVGQKALITTLKNAISTGRLAQAYLFCGPRGVGKTSCARIFAKTINCLNPTAEGEACGNCESCRAIDKGNSFNLVELDAASNNSVDDIRNITDQVNVPPQNGRYRVFIIDEVHMLSNAAFNAFLKTLEEPPKNVVFILATTEKHKVIPTILSRCQIYDFKRMDVNDIINHLEHVAQAEGIHTEREALGVIALKADGAMRDALSVFDQVAASTGGNITYSNTIENLNVLDHEIYFKLTSAFRESNVSEALMLYKEVRDKGFDSLFFINGLAEHIRNLMVAINPATVSLLEVSEDMGKKYISQASNLPVEWYYEAIRILNECDYRYKTSTSKRLSVELALIRLCQILQPSTPPFGSPVRNQPQSETGKTPKAAKEVTQKDDPAVTETITAAEPVKVYKTASESHKDVGTPGRQRSFRLSEMGDSQDKYVSTLEKRENSFTEEQFKGVWNEYMLANPSLHILINAMRTSRIEKGEKNEMRVMVDHPAQRQAFEQSMPKLLEFLRNRLANDNLYLTIILEEKSNIEKHVHPREFLKDIFSNNEVMAKFLKDIDAELI